MGEWSLQSVIRPHGEEACALHDAPAMRLMLRARAVSNHEGGPSFETRQPRPEERDALWRASRRAAAASQGTSSFKTHRTVGNCRLCDAPHDEVYTRQAVIAFTLTEAD